MMDAPVLIVGAGPTGLAAALFLAERGIEARVIDSAIEPSRTSKALGVNPRSLDLLEPSGVTARVLAEGVPLRRVAFRRRGRPLASIVLDFEAMGARFPMTILPQARTEALLTEALAGRGVAVERGLAFAALEQDASGVRVTLARADGARETALAAVLFAADGAHSDVRHALALDFPGSAYPEPWQIIDLELTVPAPDADGIVDLQAEGPFVALPFDARLWRLIGPGSDLLGRMPAGWRPGEILWRSDFRISHRMVEAMNVGRVCLGGDAAHIHSPIGARGMNLGVEDAYVFAACAADAVAGRPERLADYGRIRREVDAQVVRTVKRLTDAARSRSLALDAARRVLLPLVARTPAVRDRIGRQVTGLDHPVLTR